MGAYKTQLRSAKYLSGGIGILSLVVYFLTLAQTVSAGDSAELITLSKTLGVAHPPGYPTFLMLGHLLSGIPLGSVAARVNFLSSLCDSTAAVLLFWSAFRITSNLWAGLLAAGLFAFSPLIWSYAVVAEVFALNNFFVASMIFFAINFALKPPQTENNSLTGLFFLCFWAGLGLTNHHTFLFIAFPVLAWSIWLRRQELQGPKPMLGLLGFFLLGLLPYIYLPWMSSKVPAASWGDQTSLSGFLQHFLRRDYGTFSLGSSDLGKGGQFLARFWMFFKILPEATFYLGLPLSLFGLYKWLKAPNQKISQLGWFLLGGMAAYLTVFCYLSNLRIDVKLHEAVQARFWQQALVLICLWAGVGLAGVRVLAGWTLPLCCSIVIAGQILLQYKSHDESKNTVVRDFAQFVLNAVPQGAILITKGDFVTYPLQYMQEVEQHRTDVRVFDQNFLAYPWMKRLVARHYFDVAMPPQEAYQPNGYNMKDFLDLNISRKSIYGLNEFMQPWDRSPEHFYVSVPHGLLEQILPAPGVGSNSSGKNPDFAISEWAESSHRQFENFDPGVSLKYGDERWEKQVGILYWEMYRYFANKLIEQIPAQTQLRVVTITVHSLEKLTAHFSDSDPSLYKKLGLAYQRLAQLDPKGAVDGIQAGEGQKRAWKTYLDHAPTDDPDVAKMRAAGYGNA